MFKHINYKMDFVIALAIVLMGAIIFFPAAFTRITGEKLTHAVAHAEDGGGGGGDGGGGGGDGGGGGGGGDSGGGAGDGGGGGSAGGEGCCGGDSSAAAGDSGSAAGASGGEGCCGGDSSSAGTAGGEGGGGSGSFFSPPPQLPPPPRSTPPSCSINVQPPNIVVNQDPTLSWSSQNATGASIDQGIGSVPLSGSRSVVPQTTTTYTMTVTGPGGSAQCHTTVTVQQSQEPDCSIMASLNTIEKGEQTTLSWTSLNSNSASIDNGIGAVPTQGSRSVSPTQSTVYTMTVQGPLGSSSCTTNVNVVGASSYQSTPQPSTTVAPPSAGSGYSEPSYSHPQMSNNSENQYGQSRYYSGQTYQQQSYEMPRYAMYPMYYPYYQYWR